MNTKEKEQEEMTPALKRLAIINEVLKQMQEEDEKQGQQEEALQQAKETRAQKEEKPAWMEPVICVSLREWRQMLAELGEEQIGPEIPEDSMVSIRCSVMDEVNKRLDEARKKQR